MKGFMAIGINSSSTSGMRSSAGCLGSSRRQSTLSQRCNTNKRSCYKMPYEVIKLMREDVEKNKISKKEAWKKYAEKYEMSFNGTVNIIDYVTRVFE